MNTDCKNCNKKNCNKNGSQFMICGGEDRAKDYCLEQQLYCLSDKLIAMNNAYTDMQLKYDKLINNFQNLCCSQPITITDTSSITTQAIEFDCSATIMVAGGGGAGGIGIVDDFYYYSGGGGGSSECAYKVVYLKAGYTIKIKIGKGGTATTEAEPSWIEICDTFGNSVLIIQASAGENGHPNISEISEPETDRGLFDDDSEQILSRDVEPIQQITVGGGNGGGNSPFPIYNGQPGEDGEISFPSFIPPRGGKGAENALSIGGVGGISSESMIGSDGIFGSGGGGSIARSNIDLTKKLSGNGGDGIVKIRWI